MNHHDKYTHWFNPQNDLALANGNPNFTAPTSAVQLALAGACLPMWYGKSGDCFIGAVNAGWYKDICDAFGIGVSPTMGATPGSVPMPWGWSPQACKFLSEFGFDDKVLPSEAVIDILRDKSSRVYGARVIASIMEALPEMTAGNPTPFLPAIATSAEDVNSYIESHGVTMIKLPWSGSGRGQQVTDRTTPVELARRIAGMLNRQGAVEVSPYYHKRLDFAMLWDAGHFIGYSLFETDTHGGWTHNILLRDADIEERIVRSVGRSIDMKRIVRVMTHILDEAFGVYEGPLGVDFIVADPDVMVPVEINMRRTMGHVAHNLANRFMAPESAGIFSITPKANADEPFHTVKDCIISSGHLVNGRLDIVPPGGNFRFVFSASPH